MFKKTLLALAITGFVGSAAASTIAQTAIEYSMEGVANESVLDLDTDVAVGAGGSVLVAVGINAGYGVGDKIKFTFPNDVFDISTNAALVFAGTVAPTPTLSAPVYTGGNTVSFTITALGGGALTLANAATIELQGVNLEADNLVGGGDIVADFGVVSSVNGTDYEAKSAKIAVAKSELSAKVTAAFDAVVDVNSTRTLFVESDATDGNTNADKADKLTITTAALAGAKLPATVNKVSVTVNGDFSFLDTDADGTADYTFTVSNATDEAVAKDFQSITFSHTAVAAHELVIDASDFTTPTMIPVQDFTADVTFSYDANTANTGGTDSTADYNLNAGSWTLNGASQSIAFLPFGSDYAQSITVTNTSSLSGEITVDLTANGMTYTKVLDTAAAADSVTNISLEVAAFAAESGITDNAQIQVVVNAPTNSVEVKGLYFHKPTADRVLTK